MADKMNEKKNELLSEDQLENVAGGTVETAGTPYPGQTNEPQAPSNWAVDSGLGTSASGFKIDQPGQFGR